MAESQAEETTTKKYTVDKSLTKVGDDRRSATIVIATDDKEHREAMENLQTDMEVGRAAVAAAVDLGVPDPRIASGPTVVPVDKEGQFLTKRSQQLGGYRAIYEIKSRLV